ncbi:MAG: trypsin-like peptidase domain-containing protein [Anaerolineaceae bacterium]|nr:trypsin-like peptidase domain-containing protein [Anaerolineaceae bacterium]
MSKGIKSRTAAILNNQNKIIGSAFLITSDLLITCAHVMQMADVSPGEKIQVCFMGISEPVLTIVEEKSWMQGGEDIAFLKIIDSLPENINPFVLDHSNIKPGTIFRVFGYAFIGDYQGIWAAGSVIGRVRNQAGKMRLQLSSADLNVGHSGAPVMAEESQKVIGMLVEVVRTEKGAKHRNTAFAIPVGSFYEGLLQTISPRVGDYIGVPALPPHYLERKEEMALLKSLLFDENLIECSHNPILGLSGMGGVGKSVLAAALVSEIEIRQRFPDGVFWLTIGKGIQDSKIMTRQVQVMGK